MLEGKDGGWDKHGGLFSVGRCLEGGAYGYLCLAESHVAADKSVHRARRFHVGLHGLGRLELVRSVLVDERRLELVLQIGVGGEGEAFFLFA